MIELSIVLVIIGLIVGGVLVGRDLIEAARIRAQIAQFDQYEIAIRMFRNKYNALPGDISSVHAAQFGFESRSGADGHGDEDNLIESCACHTAVTCGPSNTAPFAVVGCESVLFWRDLSQSGLIDASLNTATDDYVELTPQTVRLYMPASKMDNMSYLHISHATMLQAGKPAFVLTGIRSSDSDGNFTSIEPSLTPLPAYAIDIKIDDGGPRSGKKMSSSTPGGMLTIAGTMSGPISTSCYKNGPTRYSIDDPALASALGCHSEIILP